MTMTDRTKEVFQDCEDYEIGGGDLVPADFKKPHDQKGEPGILRTLGGTVAALLSGLISLSTIAFLGWCAWCVVMRIFN